MAITITDSPNNFALLHQKLIYVCTSGNVANDGFRFVFEISIAGETLTFPVPPNPSNRGIMDIREVIRGYFTPHLAGDDASHSSIHQLGDNQADLHKYEDGATSNWIMTVGVTVKEGWIISGVFTPTAVGQATDTIRVYWSKFERLSGGYFPQYQSSPDYISQQFLTDRLAGLTNTKGFPESNNFGFGSNFIAIPVYDAVEYGIVSFVLDDGTLLPADTGTAEVRLTIYESDGTPHTQDYPVTANGTGRICHFGAFPGNLNNTNYVIIKPGDYPDFRCYTLQLVDGGNNTYGPLLLFYPVDYGSPECVTGSNGVKLTWINSMGGWDYFWFRKLSVNKYEVTRKRIRKVIGDYSGTAFDYAYYDPGLHDVAIQTEMMISISTDWLEEGEFQLLGNLIRSEYVLMLQSDVSGTAPIPVVIDQNNWEDQKMIGTQMKKLELTIRVANKLW
jgi:hypothetical protein